MYVLPFELESEAYWRYVDWVLEEPGLRAGPYLRPMFEIANPEPCEGFDDTEEYCRCPLN